MERIGVGFSGGMSPQDIVECVKAAEELGISLKTLYNKLNQTIALEKSA